MGITYDSICEKLGFRLEDYKPKPLHGEVTDDSPSVFSVLTYAESKFLCNYIKTHPIK